jgi:DNA-binding SARP family transcriptional activator
LRQHDPDSYCIRLDHNSYCINAELSLWIDVVEFERHAQAGLRWEAATEFQKAIAEYGVAESLYQGDFLEEDLYEEWTDFQRQHLHQLYLQITDRLSEIYMRQGEHANAIALCQRILARDKCHEPAHRRLMQCYLAQGQRHLAIHQFHICQEALRSEVNLLPSQETVLLYRRIHS